MHACTHTRYIENVSARAQSRNDKKALTNKKPMGTCKTIILLNNGVALKVVERSFHYCVDMWSDIVVFCNTLSTETALVFVY
jgi:hypothetical protein